MVRGGTALAGLLLVATLAGCIDAESLPADRFGVATEAASDIIVENSMTFRQSVVTPAVGILYDMYEPTMEVSDSGTLYVAGHVIAAATTGTPAYFSNDDGATWEQLPFLGPAQMPSPVPGAQPPPGDEGFILAGDNGQAWMVDIYAAGFTVSGWCGDGAELCYDNRYAYDRTETVTATCKPVQSLNDRPWGAYANGKLLLVNNPATGDMQIGIMDVPPATPVGLFDPVTGPVWNLCAHNSNAIPGIPAMRDDGFFAVPHMMGSGSTRKMAVVTGNAADIFTLDAKQVALVPNSYSGTSNLGRAAFDANGDLFLGAYSNTGSTAPRQGHLVLAVSADDGATFESVTLSTETAVRSLYLDSNPNGAGVLLTWSQLGTNTGKSDWYVAHLGTGPDGKPRLEHASLAVDEGPHSSAHVMGAAVGPDGRAYFTNFHDLSYISPSYPGTTPISVWIQEAGPTLG